MLTGLARVLAVLIIALDVLSSQTITSSIVGSVRDPGGLAVAGVVVTALQSGTGAEREALTNTRGDFVLSSLQPGEYTIRVTARPGSKQPNSRDSYCRLRRPYRPAISSSRSEV
jgi:hypothetical protein